MRPERVHRIPTPFRISSPARVPRAANDNVPENRASLASFFAGRSVIFGTLVLALAIMFGCAVWLGRGIWHLFS
ncbi:hypothetical protein [Bosea sp. TAF32]|uniref:hypothetical protein n=1 Tax=Bosea sp. TAF32 TaxID=3237482 RepID=UPI003F90C981